MGQILVRHGGRISRRIIFGRFQSFIWLMGKSCPADSFRAARAALVSFRQMGQRGPMVHAIFSLVNDVSSQHLPSRTPLKFGWYTCKHSIWVLNFFMHFPAQGQVKAQACAAGKGRVFFWISRFFLVGLIPRWKMMLKQGMLGFQTWRHQKFYSHPEVK
jgi:hypothetical protein